MSLPSCGVVLEAEADIAAQVAVRYTGKLASNGKVFDETKGQKTFKFRLGAQLGWTCTLARWL